MEEAGQIPATGGQHFKITFVAYERCLNPATAAADTVTMHPELRALINEACAREDCPPELRDAAAEYLSGARDRMRGPSMRENLRMDDYWYYLWNHLYLAAWASPDGRYTKRAREYLDRLISPEPP